jgi:hypothetical protein
MLQSPRIAAACILTVVLAAPAAASGAPAAKPSGKILFSCDFESDGWYKDWSVRKPDERTETVAADPDLKFQPLRGKALRIKVERGGHYGTSLQYNFRKQLGEEPEEIYFRYYLRLADDWNPARGGKLPGIAGTYGRGGWGGRKSDGRNGWSARGLFLGQKDGRTPVGFYCYHADMKGQYGAEWVWEKDRLGYLENNRWYAIEQYAKMNTPGKRDGILRAWVDGRLAFEKTDLRMRLVDTLKIESIWLNVYLGGTWTSRSDHHLYIDDVVIARQYIGPLPRAAQIPFRHVIIDAAGPRDLWQKSVGDLDGDGRLDLVAGGRSSGGLVWYQNPHWKKHVISSEGGHSTDAEVGDVDRDGDNDLVSLTTSELRWYENPGWRVHRIDARVLHDIEIADFDGDGDLDVVGRDQAEFGHRGDTLHFYRQNSPDSWSHRAVQVPNGEGLCVADIDGDGDQDVVFEGIWLENTGDVLAGPWTKHVYTKSWTYRNAFVATGDLNGDGRLDIVLAPSELAGGTYRISWFEAPAKATGQEWTEHVVDDPVETVHHFVGVADMDLDGDRDIVAAEMLQGKDPDEVKIYVNCGGGRSWVKQVIATTGSHSMRIADLDGDGDSDLYGANHQGHTVEVWQNLTR